jgi:hypothetical protein
MECLEESTRCKKCSKLLEKPILLPCGNAICEKHQLEVGENSKAIYCSICDLDHEIPAKGGFSRILALEKLIEKNINSIELGDEYKSTNERIKKFSEVFEKFEKLKTDPELIIHEKIDRIKANIDLRREELKSKIDQEALALINNLDEFEVDCKANIASINADTKTDEKLNGWKGDLNRWREQMNDFKIDDKLRKSIRFEAASKCIVMNSAYQTLKDAVFLNQFDNYRNLKVFSGSDLDLIKYCFNCLFHYL